MLTTNPIVSPNINYYCASSTIPQPQRPSQYHSRPASNGDNLILVYPHSNYYSQQIPIYENSGNSYMTAVRSERSPIRLPPISSLVPPSTYVPASSAAAAAPSSSSTVTAAKPSTTTANTPPRMMIMNDSPPARTGFLQQPSPMIPMTYMMDNYSTGPAPLHQLSRSSSLSSDSAPSSSSSSSASASAPASISSSLSVPSSNGLNPAIRLRKQCPVCGKICSRPSTLKTHYLIHTGDTPFKCTWDNCTKSFNVKSNMLRHLKSHERKLAKKEGRKVPL